MPCRYCCWTLILVLSCATFGRRRTDFEKGLELYNQSQYTAAVKHFEAHLAQHKDSDTTLYYLYDCLTKLNRIERGVDVLEQLAELDSNDENVYLNLVYYYRQLSRYKEMYSLLTILDSDLRAVVDQYFTLTRRFYAEILCGASRKHIYTSDPTVFAVTEGYIPGFPDGEFYDHDKITNAQLIILLDRLVSPRYPKKFHSMHHIPNTSYLYLPYMRLVDLGIIDYDPGLQPDKTASILTTVISIENLRRMGYFN